MFHDQDCLLSGKANISNLELGEQACYFMPYSIYEEISHYLCAISDNPEMPSQTSLLLE